MNLSRKTIFNPRWRNIRNYPLLSKSRRGYCRLTEYYLPAIAYQIARIMHNVGDRFCGLRNFIFKR